ncbi:MAG: tetratricopeptide repeat protein [Rhodoferax sp.]|nr:tetratricopeptide repeat protein [Rhodoferax sp.]
MATIPEDDLQGAKALVVDGNPNSRAILVNQLRDFGVGEIVQCTRLADARSVLENQFFDIVLCESIFANEASTGQELLDDLRRNGLLPFATVFIMVTGEATYSNVAEAAESALDGYLLKPHKASQLLDRMRQARLRKIVLQDIFTAIEWEDFERAADLCLQRYESKELFWLYAARVGAELLMRLGKIEQAQKLYEAIVEAKTLPWAKLGVARAFIDSGQPARAATALEALVSEDPTYADAYDVMGRAHFEMGDLDKALATYKLASDLTPNSVSRLQNLATMTFYAGDPKEAEKLLDRVTLIGLDSKMFDCQTLVVLAFTRLDSRDRKGLQRCRDDFGRLLQRNPGSLRHARNAEVIDALIALLKDDSRTALGIATRMGNEALTPGFDFEACSNLVALSAQLIKRGIGFDVFPALVERLGRRFCTSRSLSELLCGAARAYPPFADSIRQSNQHVLAVAQDAVSLGLRGDPETGVLHLISEAEATGNAKLIETAYQVLNRYTKKINDSQTLSERIRVLRSHYMTNVASQPAKSEQKRQAGGLTLRTGA